MTETMMAEKKDGNLFPKETEENRTEILFLSEIEEKIKKRLAEVNDSVLQGETEIENMHDYFWENYTEMDEYGYEYYDNQQALLQQANANQNLLALKRRLEKMSASPFFGKVDFRYEDEKDTESFYIGIANFAEKTGQMPLIYDWRAPVSSLFYDYDRGHAAYMAPAGMIHGEILSKWQYKIRDGHMVYAFESDVKIDDEILKQELGTGGDVKLKNIVRTIQKEQNAIIRNTKDKILVIQGAAGSGKTSIALHRIAYLLYHERERLKSSNVLILSPNGVFSDYISHILPELGEENIQEMSFDIFAYRELKGIVADCEDRYHQLERQLYGCTETEKKRFRFKQSKEFIGMVEGFLAELEDRLLDFRDISWKGYRKTESELIELFYYKFQETPILSRMDAIMEYCIDEYETLRGKKVSIDGRIVIQEKFDNLYVTKDIYKIYNWLMEELDYPLLPNVPPEKRMLEYEDVFPLLYLKYRLLGRAKHHRIKHLVIDEMQDYSYLQYTILQYLFSCRMTILGDRAQSMGDEVQDVLKFLPGIFGKNIRTIVMNKSYRNTIEIAEYANRIGGVEGIELFERHGKPVEELAVKDLKAACEEVWKHLDTEKYETAAVLVRTEKEAKAVFRILKQQTDKINYIDRDSSAFRKGLNVTTYYLAKGLEFDQVFSVQKPENSVLARQADYICATRALHELYVLIPEE